MRILGKTLVVATTAAVAFVVGPACVDNNQSIFIRQALAPSTSRQNNECLYTGDVTQPAIFSGKLDAAIRDDYSVILLVGNQMIARADNLEPRSESNKASISGAVVRVTDANGNFISTFTSPSQGFIDQSAGNEATYSPFGVTALDAPSVFKIRQGLKAHDLPNSKLVIANIKVFGQTLGGVDLESAEFQFPIQVCDGCLLTFQGFDDPNTQGVDCNLLTTSATAGSATTTGVNGAQLPCNPGQDEETPCFTCTGRQACQTGPVDF